MEGARSAGGHPHAGETIRLKLPLEGASGASPAQGAEWTGHARAGGILAPLPAADP
jgi:hypothetical protein